MSPSTWFTVLLSAGAAAVLALLILRNVKGGTKKVEDEVDPDRPRNVEKMRAASEAKANGAKHGPLSAADERAARGLVAFVGELKTSELPIVGFDADPLNAPIPAGMPLADPVLWLSGKADLRVRYVNALPAFPEPPPEPEREPPLDFTGEFRRSDLLAMFAADAEAGARR